jgi:hypothetical protein
MPTTKQLTGHDLGLDRKRALPKGAHQLIRQLASEGKSQVYIARRFAMSGTAFRRALDAETNARVAWEAGVAEREAALIHQLHHPEEYIPERYDPLRHPGVYSRLLQARQLAAMAELNAKHQWRQDQQPEGGNGRVTIEFKLPAALSPEQFRTTIDGEASRRD